MSQAVQHTCIREWGCSKPALLAYTTIGVALTVIGALALAGTFFPGVNLLSTLGSTFGTAGSYALLGGGIGVILFTILGKVIDRCTRAKQEEACSKPLPQTPPRHGKKHADPRDKSPPPSRGPSGTGAPTRGEGFSDHIAFE